MDRRRQVSIKDVAEAAGVSTTTVSHALNDKGRLPEETRARVRGVARELGYHPSAIARGLVTGRTGVLGLVASVPDVVRDSFASIEYFSKVITGATAEATRRGHALVVVPATGDVDVWQRVAVDGAVVVDPIVGDPNPDAIRAQGLALVTIGTEPTHRGPGWCVDNDFHAATAAVLDHLAAAGAEHPALLTWDWPDSYTADSIDGYERWCRARGVVPTITRIDDRNEPGQRVRELIGEQLFVASPPVDAVFALYEPLGAMVLDEAAARRVTVPDDLLVAATGDRGIGRTTAPTLTTLEFHAERLGAEAVALLIDRLEGRAPDPDHRVVETGLTVRGSTTRAA